MIRIKLGGLDIGLTDRVLLDLINQLGPRWLQPEPGEVMTLEEQSFRITVSAAFRTGLWLMGKELKKQGMPDEYLPHAPKGKGANVLLYGVGYLAWYMSLQAEAFEYHAEYVEDEHGAVAITGLAARTRFPALPAGAAGGDAPGAAVPDREADGTSEPPDAPGIAVG